MKFQNNTPLDTIFETLFYPYKTRVPDVAKISQAMIDTKIISHESEIVNDHIAFRTLGVPNLGIASIEKIFLHYGYEKRDHYYFENKKLDAYWYAPPSSVYPRIFISELRVDLLSEESQAVIHSYTNGITTDPVDSLDLNEVKSVGDFFHKPLWKLPTYKDYEILLNESEYAAWVIYNRYYLNHYTISIHELGDGYNTLEEFNEFIESLHIILNSSGGVIKCSKDGLLKQSSTVAKMIEAEFSDGVKMEIPGSYVEFAERLPLLGGDEKGNIERRDGFESANADKIFESTYKEQTRKTGN
ncbi:MAG: DUF1338 domain-containing protein [Cellulophaga sp.]